MTLVLDRVRPFYETGKRSRDLAQERGISEAELLAGHHGPEVVRLLAPMAELINALPSLGEVMSLTRNEAAVHEKVGTFDKITLTGRTGLVLNDAIDLRLFLDHWRMAFALEIPDEKGPRRSIQVFDGHGEAVIKIHLKPASDVSAFERIRDRFRDPAPGLLLVSRPEPGRGAPDSVDAVGFRSAFEEMRDIHEFFPLIHKLGLSRRASLALLDERYVESVSEGAAQALLERAAESALPIMCFVGNRGCIQIHHGPVSTIKVMGPWVNVLDPEFNLHLRQDLVREAFLVRKPTRHGLITSIELYADDGELIVQFFGVRDENGPEDEKWRKLAGSLAHVRPGQLS